MIPGVVSHKELFPCVSVVYGLTEVGIYLEESREKKDLDNSEVEEIGTKDSDSEIKAAFSAGLMDTAEKTMELDDIPPSPEKDIGESKLFNPNASQTRQSLKNMHISQDTTNIQASHMGHKDLMNVCDLPEGDGYLVQVAHGWDPQGIGGRLELLPNAPCICRTTAGFGNRMQV